MATSQNLVGILLHFVSVLICTIVCVWVKFGFKQHVIMLRLLLVLTASAVACGFSPSNPRTTQIKSQTFISRGAFISAVGTALLLPQINNAADGGLTMPTPVEVDTGIEVRIHLAVVGKPRFTYLH
jgi:hypothetical protein|tara:strand:- start:655 stop:1032 length:378 start_codon:yes stop_codon:yes gene_type:complete